MAFSESNLGCFGTCIINGQRQNFWIYNTDDTLADVTDGVYFDDLVSRDLLGENDLIYIVASDGTEIGKLENVTDAASIDVSAVALVS